MQVDLFDRVLSNRTKRQMQQIATRKFKINPRYKRLEGCSQYFNTEEEAEAYRQKILGKIAGGRKYCNIGSSASDSLFECEALGIADTNQPYVTIADFSDCLDYVLHRLYHCKINDIRSIEGYNEISKAIIDADFDGNVNIPVSRLVLASDELASHFAKLSFESKTEATECSDRATWIAYQFYLEVMNMVGFLKFYTTVVVCNSFMSKCGRKGIVRSTSHSKIVVASSVNFNEMVTLHDVSENTFDDYDVVYRTYAPYEYLGESMILGTIRNNSIV